jgi:pimeloyl-ACP methyl ester carboxylesterase
MFHIESLLSGRLFISPQLCDERIYFLSNLSGHLSLYAMDFGGSVPEPLLPSNLALQNPHLLDGYSFFVFPKLGKILVMLDQDGDENYRPYLIPIAGGFPEPAFGDFFGTMRSQCVTCDRDDCVVLFASDAPGTEIITAYRANLITGRVDTLAANPHETYPVATHPSHRSAVIAVSYTTGDNVLYWSDDDGDSLKILYGIPVEQRVSGVSVPLNGIDKVAFTSNHQGLLLTCSVFDDYFGLAYLDISRPQELQPIPVLGLRHTGIGELVSISSLKDNRYALEYNIDGCSWLYEVEYDDKQRSVQVKHILAGEKSPLTDGVVEAFSYDPASDRFILSFCSATSPTQIYTIAGPEREQVRLHTRERILGIADGLLSAGEDASYVSFDGTRVSARLYLPAPAIGFTGKRPLVYYIHGGPQGQERPDFSWFSMPLIQFLTLNGFAVFVPNVRGSTGYGLTYTKQVDRDWGGKDRLDHIHALKVLENDERVDVKRTGVVGRSYGGYMTLTLAGRHPEHWSAAVDMFGPFDLLTFLDRIPESWKPYMRLVLGDPAVSEDLSLLIDRSPKTHLGNLACPMLVIQGKNDPRVVESESRDLVEQLRQQGRSIDYLLFNNEGHDVLKYENRVRCYQEITAFFKKTLNP